MAGHGAGNAGLTPRGCRTPKVFSNTDLPLLILRALWFALPVLAAGLLHVCVIRAGWMQALARLPLDGGRRLRGRRILGDNKTLRGAAVMMLATTLTAAMLSLIPAPVQERLSVAQFQIAHPAVWGLLLGAGYIIGELPNSLLKRQLDIAPGAAATSWKAVLFWITDQLDSVFGIFLLLSLVWRPDAQFVVIVFGIALLLHPLVAALMVAMGLKLRIG
jgi:hypothetical protein